ncbi:T9SS C-terminal target domain-containing protein, partial [bacterium]
ITFYLILLLTLPAMLTAQYTGGYYGGGTSAIIINKPLPVHLSSFTSIVSGRNIKLNWVTTSEQNNSGFDIERKSTEDNFAKVGFIEGKGTVNTPSNYSYEDRNLQTGKYYYRLKQIDNNGNFEYHNLSGSVEIGIPAKFNLSQNYPNPFNPVTKINFDLPDDNKISIEIYNITGKLVTKLLNNEFRSAGYYTIYFNGSSLSSGVYFYRFIAESNGKQTIITKHMILIK